MLKNLLQNKSRIGILLLLSIFLVLVRALEIHLFYDPFLTFFKSEFYGLPLPGFNVYKLIVNLFLRYFINTILSLAIIFYIFKDIELVKFSSILYFILFFILIVSFCIIIFVLDGNNNLILFYVRRLIIQPVFLLLFVPAVFYQKFKSK